MPENVMRDVDHGWNKIKKDLGVMQKAHVKIGVLQNAPTHESGASMADIAFFNEYGTRRGIPERPFIRTTADEKADYYAKLIKREVRDILEGKSSVRRGLERVGTKAQAHVRKKIRAIKEPANAAATIKAKGSSNPLIDTGSMLRSIDFEVKL